ncbi:MAG: TIM barrel protein [Candidatus Hodarchaeales archaeon]
MVFKTGLTIQRIGEILPSKWIEAGSAIRLEHIEFDQSVFKDLESVKQVLRTSQTVIHSPYVEDYNVDLSTNDNSVDQFVENVIKFKHELKIIGVVVHPPTDAGGSWDNFFDRLEKLPFPLLENMPYQSWEDFLDFVKTTKANINNRIGMCFDIPHSWITHGEKFLDLPEQCLEFLKAPTGYIHISGGTREEDTHFTSLTEGDIPLDLVKNFLNRISFSGTVTMELRPRSFDDVSNIFHSYMIMLAIAGKRRHRFQVMVKRPFILRKIRQLTNSNPELFEK